MLFLYTVFKMSIADKILTKDVCESCGKEFSCGAKDGDCWCFEISVAAENLAKMKKDFENCLCRDCLLSNNSESSVSKKL
ncbi:MAG: cysteine-rich CWC family protein [Pyrinomonadaceae bacterium]